MSDEIIKITEDGGVTKKIITKGKGKQPPEGATVFVQYKGRFTDGTMFDSSDGYPFKFTLGEGSVIKGWELAIPTMAKGEKASLTIESDYGYGDEGVDEIPPKAKLIFEVELTDYMLGGQNLEEKADWERLQQIRRDREIAAKQDAEEKAQAERRRAQKAKELEQLQAKLAAKKAGKGNKGKGGGGAGGGDKKNKKDPKQS
eukprot:TRINITY_DN667_c1_g1_i2.p1 TRINITY_DN667_c1_g1~~TRINITY_DN667_c1_g1_i2.p1  ORF type:complete len:201 (+),score=48.05 TRINITY_DN667_c1_g1_i2:13-615(+)